MECPKWQEVGLLFVSGETNAKQSEEFNEHMKICADCKLEADQYHFEKQRFFSGDILAESPSETIDAKIKAACSRKPVITLGGSIFSGLLIKKSLIAAFFLLFGMSAGLYYTIHYSANNNSPPMATVPGKASPSSGPAAIAEQASLQKKAGAGDSAKNDKKDSLKASNDGAFPSAHRSSEGIITVDLKKE